jgi:hypothetical protein
VLKGKGRYSVAEALGMVQRPDKQPRRTAPATAPKLLAAAPSGGAVGAMQMTRSTVVDMLRVGGRLTIRPGWTLGRSDWGDKF